MPLAAATPSVAYCGRRLKHLAACLEGMLRAILPIQALSAKTPPRLLVRLPYGGRLYICRMCTSTCILSCLGF